MPWPLMFWWRKGTGHRQPLHWTLCPQIFRFARLNINISIYYYCHYHWHSYYCYHYHYFIIDTIIQVCMQYLPIPWIDTNGLAPYETKHQNIQLAYWGHDVKYCTKIPISYYISLCNKAGLSCTFSWIHVLSKIKLCVFIGSSMVVTPACETTEEHWLQRNGPVWRLKGRVTSIDWPTNKALPSKEDLARDIARLSQDPLLLCVVSRREQNR